MAKVKGEAWTRALSIGFKRGRVEAPIACGGVNCVDIDVRPACGGIWKARRQQKECIWREQGRRGKETSIAEQLCYNHQLNSDEEERHKDGEARLCSS